MSKPDRHKLTRREAIEDQYDYFLALMHDEAGEYLDTSLKLLGLDRESFAALFRSRGQIKALYHEDNLAGFYWIERRERVLHIHALILRSEYQGRGIGTEVLRDFIRDTDKDTDRIELGVHESNAAAKRLYQRLGFETIKHLPEFGFYVMQKHLIHGSDQD